MSSLPPVPRYTIGQVQGNNVIINPIFANWLDGLRNNYNATANGNIPAGAIMPTFGTENVGSIWLLLNGQSVAKRDYAALYAVLQGSVTEDASTFTLPDMTDRTVMGAGAVALMAQAGSSQITLSVGQLPAHGHSITDPGHTHVFTGTPHTHSITDPGHAHTSQVPDTNATVVAAGQALTKAGNTGSATTGITVDSATAGGTNASATTGIAVQSTGSGDDIDITPPVIGVNWLIKT